MTNPDIFPDLSKHLADQPINQSEDASQTNKFPSDYSNTEENPVYPDEDDLVPVNDLETENDDEKDQEKETLIDQNLPVEPDTDILLTRNPNPSIDIDDKGKLDAVDSSIEVTQQPRTVKK